MEMILGHTGFLQVFTAEESSLELNSTSKTTKALSSGKIRIKRVMKNTPLKLHTCMQACVCVCSWKTLN